MNSSRYNPGLKKSSLVQKENYRGLLSVMPVVLMELAACGYPIAVAIGRSFTNWDGLYKNDFIGLTNYIKILTGSEFRLLVRNSFVLLLSIPIQVFIGLVLAVILYEKIKGWKLFRMVYYLPSIISAVTVGYLFKILFSYTGPVNRILSLFLGSSFAFEWLGNGMTALLIILFCIVWSNIGWQVLIFFGGLSSIDTSVLESAMIDGAGWWQRLFHIILPILVRTIEYSFIMSMIYIFSGIFPLIETITRGGPGYETTTIDYMIYTKAFTNSRYGEACALAVILLIIILAITKLQMSAANKIADWEG
mgnify:CR=1 FL=1